MRKIILLSLMVMFFTQFDYAQDTTKSCNSSLDVSVSFVSRYVWRGADFGRSPAIQPTLQYNIGNLSVGSWGSYTTNGSNCQESDIYVSYTLKDVVSFTITDYFFPNDDVSNNHYFIYDDKITGHVFEASATFNGTDDIPLTFLAAVNYFGADSRRISDDGSAGDIMYSSYFELGYSGECKGTAYNVFIGGTPTRPDLEKGESGFYGKYAGVVNLGVTAYKDVQISESFSLPLSCSFITNPQAENIFLVIGFSL